MRRAALLALMVTCGAAHASQWVQVGTGKDGTKVWVDTSSIAVTGSIRQAWLKMTFPVHTQPGSGDDAGKWVDFSLNHAAFNCSDGTSRSDALENDYDDGSSRKVPAEENCRRSLGNGATGFGLGGHAEIHLLVEIAIKRGAEVRAKTLLASRRADYVERPTR